jgi:Proteasome activator pa28 beta subunit
MARLPIAALLTLQSIHRRHLLTLRSLTPLDPWPAPKAFQEQAKSAALEVLKGGPETVAQLQQTYASRFDKTLQQQHDAYEAAILAAMAASSSSAANVTNPDCADAVSAAKAATEAITTRLSAVEQYITWNIPKMEDGGNFGVTVQLAVIKHVQDLSDKLVKGAEELSKYHASRADALEKCKNLPSTSVSKTVSKSTSEATGGKEEGKESKASDEDKTTTSTSGGADAAERAKAVVAVDCLYWYKAKVQLQTIITGYVSALDFLEKNSTKIAQPKGSQGSGGHFSSMY